jgi:hypothetical protein
MRTLPAVFAAAVALAFTSVPGHASKQHNSNTQLNTSSPQRISTTGQAQRSTVVTKHGANAKGFCPPGQAKKPGRGSAFRC